jgi:hypothetical protein
MQGDPPQRVRYAEGLRSLLGKKLHKLQRRLTARHGDMDGERSGIVGCYNRIRSLFDKQTDHVESGKHPCRGHVHRKKAAMVCFCQGLGPHFHEVANKIS